MGLSAPEPAARASNHPPSRAGARAAAPARPRRAATRPPCPPPSPALAATDTRSNLEADRRRERRRVAAPRRPRLGLDDARRGEGVPARGGRRRSGLGHGGSRTALAPDGVEGGVV